MSVIAGLFAGLVAGWLALVVIRPALGAPVFVRRNYRNHELPTGAGVAVAAGVLLVEAAKAVGGALGVGDAPVLTTARTLTMLTVVGFTLLGLADDLGAMGSTSGFGGHLRSIVAGSVSTGGIKLIGGGLLALVLGGPAGHLGGATPGPAGVARLLVDGAVIALSANLANLFDRAPGRVIKMSMLMFAVLAIPVALRRSTAGLGAVAVVIGAATGVLPSDLRETSMLGDTGANAVGASLGLGVVLMCAPWVRFVVLLGLLAMNLVSERVSFSAIIDAVAPLRALDRFGGTEQRKTFRAAMDTSGSSRG